MAIIRVGDEAHSRHARYAGAGSVSAMDLRFGMASWDSFCKITETRHIIWRFQEMQPRRTRRVPLKMGWASKSDVRTQFAALCYRKQGRGLQILLITGRRTKRWALPRGWPMNGLTPSEAAAVEAWEEGGVKGTVSDVCIGIYSYTKLHGNFAGTPCIVAVFPLKVKKLSDEFPEADERERRWFSQKQAVARVDTPGLRQIIRHFNPGVRGQVSGVGCRLNFPPVRISA